MELHPLQEGLAQGIADYCRRAEAEPAQLLPFPTGLGRQQVVARALALLDLDGPQLLIVDRVLAPTWQEALAAQGLVASLATAAQPDSDRLTLMTPALLVRLSQQGYRPTPLALLVRAYGLGVKDGSAQRDQICRALAAEAARSWTVTGLAVSPERAASASALGRALAQGRPWAPAPEPPSPLFPDGPPLRGRLSPLAHV